MQAYAQSTPMAISHHKQILLVVFMLLGLSAMQVDPDDTRHCLNPEESGPCKFCQPGWYGDDCSRRCSMCDGEGCEQESGVCHRCPPGYYTPNCNQTCPSNCREKDNNVYCDQHTGKCLEHCKNSSWWGHKCDQKCSERCVDGSCMFSDGSCAEGCVPGWSGNMCMCPDTCVEETCSDEGECTKGCEQGLFGPLCDKTCDLQCECGECDKSCLTDGPCTCAGTCRTCHQDTGRCTSCSVNGEDAQCYTRSQYTALKIDVNSGSTVVSLTNRFLLPLPVILYVIACIHITCNLSLS